MIRNSIYTLRREREREGERERVGYIVIRNCSILWLFACCVIFMHDLLFLRTNMIFTMINEESNQN